MDLVSVYAPVFLEAQTDCNEHRREMCQIVISDKPDQEILTELRDSILRYRAKSPKKEPEVKEFPTDKIDYLKFFAWIKFNAEFFEKHDHLVDLIAGDLKNEEKTLRDRLDSIRNHLM